MPHTIHPDQKPSDDETFWIERVKQENALAVETCKTHAENVRVAKYIEGNESIMRQYYGG